VNNLGHASDALEPRKSRKSIIVKWIKNPVFVTCCILMIAAILVLPWDAVIAHWCRQEKLPGELRAFVRLAETFAHGYGIAAIIITLLLIDPLRRRDTLWTAAGTALGGVMANVIKLNVARLRPHTIETLPAQDWAIGWQGMFPWLQGWEGWIDRSLQAFPSGHTATAAALATCLGVTYPQARWWFAVLAGLAGLQRIDAGAHFPSDVFAGAAVGVACGAFTMRISRGRSKPKARSKQSKTP
jgi:membrane-associated phospholipid phosphatase